MKQLNKCIFKWRKFKNLGLVRAVNPSIPVHLDVSRGSYFLVLLHMHAVLFYTYTKKYLLWWYSSVLCHHCCCCWGAGGVLSCPKSVIECHCHCLLFAIVLGITRVFVNYVLLLVLYVLLLWWWLPVDYPGIVLYLYKIRSLANYDRNTSGKRHFLYYV